MTCKELVEQVTDYLESTLHDDVRIRLENHLSGCDCCTNCIEQMRQTVQLTAGFREQNLTPNQRDDLLRLFRNWKKAQI